ncbi:glycoside hydrolase family 43 protein [Actinoplanes ianthinogenes]|uniref:glycoside hydrolase family 43 protein n=1 Tax=Actinoplanes ianthinogenes TaxID=122358 RepID=UPI001E617496|nr:glycoside hydrolase family 43 protein [Actinoplanes ianthinogenes]
MLRKLAAAACLLALLPAAPARAAQTSLRASDPSVLRVGGTYVGVQSVGDRGIAVRQASSTGGLATAAARTVWSDTGDLGEVWAPEIHYDGGRFYIYFTAGRGAAHRMYVISSATADSGYTGATRIALPDDRWAIDGTMVVFNGQRWFVWSGWAGTTNVEQNLYIARMTGPATVTGARYVISQPRESWERVVGNPYINEAPEAIRDPDGRLHIVYSANGSWSDQYCLGELRLRAGGDPAYVWDWYKSNGCLFGSNRATMMAGGLGPDAVRQRARPPQLRAAQRRHRDQPAGRPALPADVPRGPEGHAVHVGEPLLVHRHVLLVGQHHVLPGERSRAGDRHRVQSEVLRMTPRVARFLAAYGERGVRTSAAQIRRLASADGPDGPLPVVPEELIAAAIAFEERYGGLTYRLGPRGAEMEYGLDGEAYFAWTPEHGWTMPAIVDGSWTWGLAVLLDGRTIMGPGEWPDRVIDRSLEQRLEKHALLAEVAGWPHATFAQTTGTGVIPQIGVIGIPPVPEATGPADLWWSDEDFAVHLTLNGWPEGEDSWAVRCFARSGQQLPEVIRRVEWRGPVGSWCSLCLRFLQPGMPDYTPQGEPGHCRP